MGETLSPGGFSFRNRTIREYTDANGQPLYIFDAANIKVPRLDRSFVDSVGNDGAKESAYDGNDLTFYFGAGKKYAVLPASGSN
jgi:Predicted periplasmic protein (DUF2092)